MESLYLWIPVILLFTLASIAIYLWAVHSGQYDDLDREGERLLFEEDNKQQDE